MLGLLPCFRGSTMDRREDGNSSRGARLRSLVAASSCAARCRGPGARRRRRGPKGLTGASLAGANLYGALLTGALLTGALLTGADLARADLTRADLTEADLARAVWPESLTPPLGWEREPHQVRLKRVSKDPGATPQPEV
jgi:uncharacterized protein YjbI with pentapeptide repeats